MQVKAGTVTVDLIDDDDRVVVHAKRDGGVFEPVSMGYWCGFVQPDAVAMDVGAYTGIYAIAAAKLGAQVVAFEPMPTLGFRLLANAQLNDAELTLVRAAASDIDGHADLRFSTLPFTSGASIQRLLGPNKIRVETKRLDTVWKESGRPHVAAIKIDVEGHEAAVVWGARELIAACRPHMIIETLDGPARAAVIELVPNYRVLLGCDRRNIILSPTGTGA
jgi:FkbM family methyltransferase